MKYHYPKNVILDVKTPSSQHTNDYWVNNYSSSFTKSNYYATSLNLISSTKTVAHKAVKKTHMNTVTFNSPHSYYNTVSNLTKPLTAKAKHLRSLRASSAQDWNFSRYDVQTSTTGPARGERASQSETSSLRNRSLLPALFDINFIKKERLYTKLKYSRSPAYDIVSGGSAALLAGFIGFLISEKFGIELVDSGDFYIGFMYAVFFALPFKLILKMMSQSSSLWSIISPNYLFYYLADVLRLVVSAGANLFSGLWVKVQSLLLTNSLVLPKDVLTSLLVIITLLGILLV